MSSRTSSRTRSYRDDSPVSPLSPLSPGALPRWFRSGAPRSGMLSSSRIKTYTIVLVFMLLGFWATSALGPSDEGTLGPDGEVYDTASGSVLSDPSGYGQSAGPNKSMPGIIGSDDDEDELDVEEGYGKKPTVKGALSELHHAVTDKLQSWNPYQGRPPRPRYGGGQRNKTASAKSGKKPPYGVPVIAGGEDVKEGMDENDRLGARTRVGKCTIVFNGNSYWERALRTHEQHDRVQGYRLHVLRQDLLDDVWSKPAYILSLLLRELGKPESDRLEWLFWVDADTIILNPYVPIETLLPPPGSEFDDVHLMYTNDWNGLNNGVFPVRVNRWSVELFSAILAYRYYRPDASLVFRDQSAMDALMKEPKFAKHVVQTPQRWFNAYQGEHNETLAPFQIRRGDLLVHFAGVPGREERMAYWLDRAEQHLDDWEIPMKSTSYPQEARDFWSEQRAIRQNRQKFLTDVRSKAQTLISKTDERLNTFGDRLTDEQKTTVTKARDELKKLVDDEHWQDESKKMEDLTKKLQEACEPVKSVAEFSQKALLTSAHEAIFAGEKDLLESGLGNGKTSPELQHIDDSVKSLKNLVMLPQEQWDNKALQTAVDAVVKARGRLQEKEMQAKAAARAKAELEEARVKAVEEARKQVLAEANGAAGDDGRQVEKVSDDAKGGKKNATEDAGAAKFAADDDGRFVPSEAKKKIVPPAVMPAEKEVVLSTAVQAVETVTNHVVTMTPEAVVVYTTAVVASEVATTTEIRAVPL